MRLPSHREGSASQTERVSSGSAERALELLQFLAGRSRPVPSTMLVRECGIPKSSLHRLMSGLQARGFVVRGEGNRGWVLGPEAARLAVPGPSISEAVAVLDAFERGEPSLDPSLVAARARLTPERAACVLDALLGHGLVARDGDGWTLAPRLLGLAARIEPLETLRQAARPILADLRDETGETANLVVRDGDEAIYIDQVVSRHALRHAGWAGRSIPLAGTAAGAALTRETLEPQVVRDAVEQGVTAIAAKVPFDGIVPAAVSLIAPTHRLSDARLDHAAAAVISAASAVGQALTAHFARGASL
jgi:IclR family acetate operon transcriptional repressor